MATDTVCRLYYSIGRVQAHYVHRVFLRVPSGWFMSALDRRAGGGGFSAGGGAFSVLQCPSVSGLGASTYVCVCVYILTCIHTHTRARTHTHMYAYIYTYRPEHMAEFPVTVTSRHLAHAEGALYGTELGSVTLKRIGFFCFPIKHSTHTGV